MRCPGLGVREAKSGTGSGGSWCSPRHSAPALGPVSALHATPISLLEPRLVCPTAQCRPLEESAAFLPRQEESPKRARGLYARDPPPEQKETFHPATMPECRSSRKCGAERRRPAELPLSRYDHFPEFQQH